MGGSVMEHLIVEGRGLGGRDHLGLPQWTRTMAGLDGFSPTAPEDWSTMAAWPLDRDAADLAA